MKTIDVYQVTRNSDRDEWKWIQVLVANFTKKADAEIAKVWKCVMWSDWRVEQVSIKVFETLDEYQELTWDFPKELIKKIKDTALSKLTPREKKILWLS